MGSESIDEAGAVLARVEEIVATGGALQEVLDRVVGVLRRDDLRGAAVGLIDENRELYIAAYAGHLDAAARDARLPLGVGIMGRVAATGSAALVDDLDYAHPANRRVGTNARIRSLVCVPVRIDGDVIGVLEADSSATGRFNRSDVDLLHRVARALAPALRDAGPLRLANEQLRRRLREVEVLQQVTRTVSTSLELPAVLEAIVIGAATALAAPIGLIMHLEADGLRTVAAAVRGQAQPVTGRRLSTGGLPELEAVLAHGRPVAVGAFIGRVLVAAEAGVPELEICACVAVPLRFGGDAVEGILLVATDSAHRHDPTEVRMLEGIADIAGLAIANAQRYRALDRAASVDALTGLANASAFERALAVAHPDGLAVVALDLDRLKEINDQGGYEAGDEALRRIAVALRGVVDAGATVARTGGDEFAVLLPGVDEAGATAQAERIRRTLEAVVLPAGLCRVTLGIAAGGPAGEGDARLVWWWASEALDSNKQWGRDRVAGAGQGAVTRESRQLRWTEVIEQTLADHSLDSVFQPVVQLGTREVIGYEALARPRGHGDDQSVEAFFTVAQRLGEARNLDWLARRAALDRARELRGDVALFINVGVWALLDPVHGVDQMALLCEWGRRSPTSVILEITERELISDMRRLEEVLATYRAEGFRFAVDDVGEGHSTFEVLAAASPEYIKVARSLTIGRDRVGARSAIHAVVAFARSSGATVIAEGIESETDAEVVAELGIELGQGWLLGRPGRLPETAIDRRLHIVEEPPTLPLTADAG